MNNPPPAPQAQIHQALEAFKARDRDLAAAIVADLVRADPPLGSTWGSISRLAQGLGEISSALAAAERLAGLNQNNIFARLNLAGLLAQYGRIPDALTLADTLVDEQPNLSAAWHLRGSLRSQLGETEGAIKDFRRAIALSTDASTMAHSLLSLSEAKRYADAGDSDLGSIQTLLEAWPAGAPAPGKAALFYALGKANDDLGRTDTAFSAYAQGAAIMDRLQLDDGRAADAFVDDIVSGFTGDFMARLPKSDVRSHRPIFVLGPPRSGTTLVEQILVSHSQVLDGAELNLFRTAAMPVDGFSSESAKAFAKTDPQGFSKIGEAYLGMLDQRFGPEGRIVDKTLNHSRFLGLIHRVLPNARFIWLRRDPAAVAWSCFRTWFAQGVEWSWSLDSIARHLKSEDRLHAHWTAIMGDAILTVPYEGLVQDPPRWIARMLDHLDLPFEPGLEDFHQTERAVTTASFAQVRRPIYGTSTDAWQRYRTHLEPFSRVYDA